MKITKDFFKSFQKLLLNNTSAEISLEVFRNHIRACQNISTNPKACNVTLPFDSSTSKIITEICDLLFNRLRINSIIIEPQFLCAKTLFAFVNILSADDKTKYLDKIHMVLVEYSKKNDNNENYWKQLLNTENKDKNFVSDITIMSLINGFFNYNLKQMDHFSLFNICERILQESLKIVIKSCMRYSNTTFVSFRNLSMIINKIIEWNMHERISQELISSLSFVILYNWESPFAGIKDYNSDILTNYLDVIDDNIDNFLNDVMNFSWNKAKYYCLCEIIQFKKNNGKDVKNLYQQFIQGLRYSLYNCHLVSAGTELYKIIVNDMDDLNEWYGYFFEMHIEVLLGKDNTAKQSLLNHWLPVITKKHPEVITLFINNMLEHSSDNKVEYSFLHMIKLARKAGFVLSDWEDDCYNALALKNALKLGLDNSEEDVRLQAIQVISCVFKVSIVPTKEEFEMFKLFFTLNVNCDSTSFRQNLLNCYTDFLVHLRDSYLHITKCGQVYPKNEDLVSYILSLEDFFVWLYKFIVDNLQNSGNYQRKYTSLQMFDITMRYLCHGYVDNEVFKNNRKGNLRYMGWKVMDHLKKKDKWRFDEEKCIQILIDNINDPTNDIHNSAVNILSQYYSNNAYLIGKKNNLFITAMCMCNSKLFYEVESGCAIIKLLSKHYIPGDKDIKTLNPSNEYIDMLDYMIDICNTQFKYHKEDILLSIYNNQPLHGIISAISTFIKNYRSTPQPTTVKGLTILAHDIVKLYLSVLLSKTKSSDKTYPPSFAEMSLSIDYIIQTSIYKPIENIIDEVGTSDSTSINVHTTNLHQLVLNNIWCNLKACCELSSTIINTCCETLDESYVKKCLEINTLILTRCRHKGAIESAGLCLGQCVRYITSSGNSVNIEFIVQILQKYLMDATSQSALGRSITRRSAGLTILVHRIVTNDMQDGKPLFYHAMNILFNVLNIYDNYQMDEDIVVGSTSTEADSITNANDIPQATALHLMCRTVSDSSLTHYVIQFASKLLSICFKYFTSKEWQISNAALQLYGALIPKLIGQKSRSGNLCSKSPMSADELFSHIPGAWQHIISSLRTSYCLKRKSDILLNHSNLVPILSLLSNMAPRYELQQINTPPSLFIEKPDIEEIFVYIISLLGSPIYNVRNLCARIIESFYSVKRFYDHWNHTQPKLNHENELHGYLLVLKYYIKYLKYLKEYTPDAKYDNLKTMIQEMADWAEKFIREDNSFITKTTFMEVMIDLESPNLIYMDSVIVTFALAEQYENDINVKCGFYTWLEVNINYFVNKCENDSLGDLSVNCFNNKCILQNGLLPAIKNRIINNMPKFYIIKVIAKELINRCQKDNQQLNEMLEILYTINNKTPIDLVNIYEQSFIDSLISWCEINGTYNGGYLLPLICNILMKKYTLTPHIDICDTILNLSNTVKNLSDVNKFDSEARYFSAISAKHLAIIVSHLNANMAGDNSKLWDIKKNVLSTIFWLLQDEDSDIRHESAKILFSSEQTFTHPSKRLEYILSTDFLNSFFRHTERDMIKFLRTLYKEIKSNEKTMKDEKDFENPFDHNTKNVYWELKTMQCKIWDMLPIAEPTKPSTATFVIKKPSII